VVVVMMMMTMMIMYGWVMMYYRAERLAKIVVGHCVRIHVKGWWSLGHCALHTPASFRQCRGNATIGM